MFDESSKEVDTMAVMSKPKAVIPVLSEENSKKILSMPVNKSVISRMFRISNKVRGKENKKA